MGDPPVYPLNFFQGGEKSAPAMCARLYSQSQATAYLSSSITAAIFFTLTLVGINIGTVCTLLNSNELLYILNLSSETIKIGLLAKFDVITYVKHYIIFKGLVV